jgi:hypothetical protein
MKTFAYLGQYLLILLEFQANLLRKLKTHFLFNISSRKSCRLWDNVENFVRAGEPVDDIIRSMRFACWIIKDAKTHWEYVIVISFPRRQWLSERTSILHLYVCHLSCSSEKKTGLPTDQSRPTTFDVTNPLIYISYPKCDWACRRKPLTSPFLKAHFFCVTLYLK